MNERTRATVELVIEVGYPDDKKDVTEDDYVYLVTMRMGGHHLRSWGPFKHEREALELRREVISALETNLPHGGKVEVEFETNDVRDKTVSDRGDKSLLH